MGQPQEGDAAGDRAPSGDDASADGNRLGCALIGGSAIVALIGLAFVALIPIAVFLLAPMIFGDDPSPLVDEQTRWQGSATCDGATRGTSVEFEPEGDDAVTATVNLYAAPPEDGQVVGEPIETFPLTGTVDGATVTLSGADDTPWPSVVLEADDEDDPTELSGRIDGSDCTGLILERS